MANLEAAVKLGDDSPDNVVTSKIITVAVKYGDDSPDNVTNDKILIAEVKYGDDSPDNVTNDKILIAEVKLGDDKPKILSYTVFNTGIKEQYGTNKLSASDIEYLAWMIWNFDRKKINERTSIGKALDDRTKLIVGLQ